MATVIKKISELEHLEELTSSSNVIIEENGEAKLFPAASIGSAEMPEITFPVTSVNGMTGDVVIEVGAGSGTGSSVQSDYNQNDPIAADYIKNRTHYKYETEVELFNDKIFLYSTGWCDGSELQLSIDKTYRVVFDGVTYECAPYSFTDNYGYVYTAIGRSTLLGTEEDFGNGEPFLFFYDSDYDETVYTFMSRGVTHTISIYALTDGVETTIFEDKEFYVGIDMYSYDIIPAAKITSAGEEYVVVFNGEVYNFVSKYIEDDEYYYIGVDPFSDGFDEDVQFFIGYNQEYDETAMCTWSENLQSGFYNVQISKVSTVFQKLNPKYLPEGGVGYTEPTTETQEFDLIQIGNDLGAELKLSSSSNSVTGRHLFGMEVMGCTDMPLSLVAGSEYEITVNHSSHTYLAVDGSNERGYPCFWVGDYDALVTGDFSDFECVIAIECPNDDGWYFTAAFDAEAFNISVSEGEYGISYESIVKFTLSRSIVTDVVYKIDPKFLAQPDWNENDPNEGGYIANRPFYEAYVAGEVLFEEQTFEDFSGGQLPEPVAFVEGETYFVTFDGQQYECVAWFDETLNSMFGEDAVGLGSTAFIGHTNEGGNNEPFFLGYTGDYTGFSVENSGTHTLKIQSATMAVAKKIDKKFLPDDVGGGQADWNQNDEAAPNYIKNRPFSSETFEEEVVVVPEQTFNTKGTGGHFTLSDSKPLTDGKAYTVVFNGQQHECVAYTNNNVVKVDGSQEIGGYTVPFEVQSYDDGGVVFFSNYVNEYTIKVTCIESWETVEKINPKYLPDLFSGSWDDITDKPFDDGEVLFDFTVDNATEIIYDNDGDPSFGKFSDVPIGKTEWTNLVITTYNEHGDTVLSEMPTGIFTSPSSEGMYWAESYIEIALDHNSTLHHTLCEVISVEADSTTYLGATLTRGVWTKFGYDDMDNVAITRATVTKMNKTLDPLYMPPADWSENNELLGTHIKNRTHYTQSFKDYNYSGDVYSEDRLFMDILYRVADGDVAKKLTNDALKASNITVAVVADGKTETMQVPVSELQNMCSFTDEYAFISEFVVVVREDYDLGLGTDGPVPAGVYFLRLVQETNTVYTSCLSYPLEVVTLPEIYIPDTIARKDDFISYVKTDLIYDGDGFIQDGTLSIDPNKRYVVDFDGTDYLCRVRSEVEGYYSIGNYYLWFEKALDGQDEEIRNDKLAIANVHDTKEPFCFVVKAIDNEWDRIIKESGTHTVRIYEAEVDEINAAYLSNTFVTANDLFGAFEDTSASMNVCCEWDRNKIYDEVVEVPNEDGSSITISLVKISDNAPESEFFIGKYLYMSVLDSNTSAEYPVFTIKPSDIEAIEGCYTVYNCFVVVTKDLFSTPLGVELTRGVWAYDVNDVFAGSDMRISNIRITDKRNIIAEALIPHSVARTKNTIATPLTAQVGQTIVVKAVDSNGKPIEWECVDLPSGGATSWNDLEDKPFGEEGSLEPLVENESPEIQNYDGLLQCDTLIIPLVAGEKYKVILDGMEYQFTATEGDFHGNQCVYIGSEQMFNDINAGTNGDFFIVSVWEDGQCVYTMLCYYTDNPTITLSVYKDTTVIHPLDEKFIPDTIARSADIPEVNYPVTSVNGMTGEVVIDAMFYITARQEDIVIDESSTDTLTTGTILLDKDYAEIRKAFLDGRNIAVLYYSDNSGAASVLPLSVTDMDDNFSFATVLFGNGQILSVRISTAYAVDENPNMASYRMEALNLQGA